MATIQQAEKKLLALVPIAKLPKASKPGSFVMSVFRSTFLPALPAIIGELLKKLSKTQKKYLIATRDALVDAELD